MKTRLTVVTAATLTAVAAALFVSFGNSARPVHAAGGGCPASYAAGFFGFSGDALTTGTSFVPGLYATAGVISLAADPGVTTLTGTINGYQTINNRGVVTRVDFTGSYAMVAAHCYGLATIIPSSGPTTHFDLVPIGWTNGGIPNRIRFVETDSHGIGTLVADAF